MIQLVELNLRWEYIDNIYETDESTIEYYEVMIKDGWKPLSPWYEEMAADMGDPKKIAQELRCIIYWFRR